ncbi:Competence F protein [Anaerovibrio sp. JC8]|uniref:ComF family protein n=1 Tax=Anaerovibrio sp. JC8 TaxID=1240085 RepID=UPI000A0A380C|nr:ComF family protein [Anaerovibrio sp. JC8]ORU00600.1 Competence F protein [Anaerovibrio sp. JC8]
MLEAILNFLFPPRCPGCGSYVKHNGQWCEECLNKILRVRKLPLDDKMGSVFDGGVLCFCDYEDPVKKLIADAKFEKKKNAVKKLQFFVDRGFEKLDLHDIDIVVPVPLHKNKIKQRGFNQSILFFEDAMKNSDLEIWEVLRRVHETRPQFGLKFAERKKNIKGAFAVADKKHRQLVRGKTVLLVDDIFTTGATFAECGKVLREAGASRIFGLVIASNHK